MIIIYLLFIVFLIISLIGTFYPGTLFKDTRLLETVVLLVAGLVQAYTVGVIIWVILEIHRALIIIVSNNKKSG